MVWKVSNGFLLAKVIAPRMWQTLFFFSSSESDHKFLYDENSRRNVIIMTSITIGMLPASASFGKTKSKNPYDERRLLEQNKRRQKENNVPDEFPNFIREGRFISFFKHPSMSYFELQFVILSSSFSPNSHGFFFFSFFFLNELIMLNQKWC